jgi:hypothetical protein
MKNNPIIIIIILLLLFSEKCYSMNSFEKIGKDIFGKNSFDMLGNIHGPLLSRDGNIMIVSSHMMTGGSVKFDTLGTNKINSLKDLKLKMIHLSISPQPDMYPVTSSKGEVYIYKRTSSEEWFLHQTISNGKNNDFFGFRIGLSEDGKTLAVGTASIYTSSSSSVFAIGNSATIFIYRNEDVSKASTTSWILPNSGTTTMDSSWKIFDPVPVTFDAEVFPFFSLSGDGRTIVRVGQDKSMPSFKIYRLTSNTTPGGLSFNSWTQVFKSSASNSFYYSSSISFDGSVIAVGLLSSESKTSHVNIVRRTASGTFIESKSDLGCVFSTEQRKLKTILTSFGRFISLSSDGNTIAVGSPYDRPSSSSSSEVEDEKYDNFGKVYVYRWSPTTSNWNQLGQTIDRKVALDWFGSSLSLSVVSSSNSMIYEATLAIGSMKYPVEKSTTMDFEFKSIVDVYKLNSAEIGSGGGKWRHYGNEIIGENYFSESNFPCFISVDGKTLAISSPMYDSPMDKNESVGIVQVFDITRMISESSSSSTVLFTTITTSESTRTITKMIENTLIATTISTQVSMILPPLVMPLLDTNKMELNETFAMEQIMKSSIIMKEFSSNIRRFENSNLKKASTDIAVIIGEYVLNSIPRNSSNKTISISLPLSSSSYDQNLNLLNSETTKLVLGCYVYDESSSKWNLVNSSYTTSSTMMSCSVPISYWENSASNSLIISAMTDEVLIDSSSSSLYFHSLFLTKMIALFLSACIFF